MKVQSLLTAGALLVLSACPSDAPVTTNDAPDDTSATSTEPPVVTTGSSGDAPTTAGEASANPTTGPLETTGTGTDTTSSETGSSETGSATSDDTGDSSGGGESSTSGTSGGDESGTGDETTNGVCSEPGADAELAAMELGDVVEGVLFTSESDYPWTVFTLACSGPVTIDNVKEIIGPVYVQNPDEQALIDRTIEEKVFAQFFDKLTVPQDWWDDFYVEQGMKYAAIREVLEQNLTDLRVFRLGEQSGNVLSGAIDVYILGRAGDDLVGMWTIAVET